MSENKQMKKGPTIFCLYVFNWMLLGGYYIQKGEGDVTKGGIKRKDVGHPVENMDAPRDVEPKLCVSHVAIFHFFSFLFIFLVSLTTSRGPIPLPPSFWYRHEALLIFASTN